MIFIIDGYVDNMDPAGTVRGNIDVDTTLF